jgi:hypothetical protein
MDPPSVPSHFSNLFSSEHKEFGIEIEFPEDIQQQIHDFHSVAPDDPTFSQTLVGIFIVFFF